MLKRKQSVLVAQVERAPHFFEVVDPQQLVGVADELANPGAVVVVELSRLPNEQRIRAVGFMEGFAHALAAAVEPITKTRYVLKNAGTASPWQAR